VSAAGAAGARGHRHRRQGFKSSQSQRLLTDCVLTVDLKHLLCFKFSLQRHDPHEQVIMMLIDVYRSNPLGARGNLAQRYGELVKDLWSATARSIAPLKLRVSLSFSFTQYCTTQTPGKFEFLFHAVLHHSNSGSV